MNEQFVNTIEQIAKAWQMPVLQKLVANIKQKKLISSRDLLNSLSSETLANLSSAMVTISFAFEDYGRYNDMKRLKWSEQPPIEDIIEWVKKKGIQSFKDRAPKPNKPTERRLNEIAWGIARKKLATQKYKSRPWFQSTFYKSLNALQEELMLGIADRTIEGIKDSLTERIKI